MNVTETARRVNSKTLFKKMNETIREGITTIGIQWNNEEERALFVDILNSVLNEVYITGAIEQWKIQSNSKNNFAYEMLNGIFYIDVYYKQKNCLNTTQITYKIQA